MILLDTDSLAEWPFHSHAAVLRCLVQVLVNSDQQNTWPLLCLNFVGQCLLAACLAGGLGKLTHTLSASLQMKWKCMAGPEGLELSYGGVAKSVMLNIPTLA